MAGLRILVSGASIAGSTTAYWLAKGGARVTVIERASSLRTAGQGIDVEGQALEIIRRMGIEDKVRQKTTGETGIAFLDDKGKTFAVFDIADEDNNIGFTSDIEIMRGDLATILFQATDAWEGVKYRFGTTIESLSQRDDGVRVRFNAAAEEDFDLVIVAEGLGSQTRNLIIPHRDREACKFSLDAYLGYFSIPRQSQDGPRSRVFQAIGRRNIFIRPRDQNLSSVYLGVIKGTPELTQAAAAGVAAQKKVLTEVFKDVQYSEVPRVLRELADADDFYFQHVAQIRLRDWYRGRCVLVGDAAYCPSPFSGQGTALAIQGAYILAGEICSRPAEPEVAFQNYQRKMNPYVRKAQSISWDGRLPKLINPESAWGLWVLRWITWTLANSGVLKLGRFVKWLSSRGADRRVHVPEYTFAGDSR